MASIPITGSGLGLRRGLFKQMARHEEAFYDAVDFVECAPENWIGVGGRFGSRFREYAERLPIVCHGLSLSLGSPSPIDFDFLEQIKAFLGRFNARVYSEHLSACSDHGHLYDLMPIPFTEAAIRYVADRIRTVQDVLERQVTIEHISYYAAPGQELSEIEFINAILSEADCQLLLDVNNVYVNSVNFGYDAVEFLKALPAERVSYMHIAGHLEESEDLYIDTHAASIVEPVWDLLDKAYEVIGVRPTLVERDFNFPPLRDLLAEVERVKRTQEACNLNRQDC